MTTMRFDSSEALAIMKFMALKLSPEQREAVRQEGGPVQVEDEQTHQLYVLVDSTAYDRAMQALRHQQDREAIREGIADMEAGRVAPLDEVCARIRTKLGLPESG